MSLDRSVERVGSGDGASSKRCEHSDFRLAAGSALLLVVVLLASLLLTRPDPVDAAKPIYRLGTTQQAGAPASVGVSADGESLNLDVGSPLTISGSFGAAGGPTLKATLLNGSDLGVILGVMAFALLVGFVVCRSRAGRDRWGCQCGEWPLVRTAIPNNHRSVRSSLRP